MRTPASERGTGRTWRRKTPTRSTTQTAIVGAEQGRYLHPPGPTTPAHAHPRGHRALCMRCWAAGRAHSRTRAPASLRTIGNKRHNASDTTRFRRIKAHASQGVALPMSHAAHMRPTRTQSIDETAVWTPYCGNGAHDCQRSGGAGQGGMTHLLQHGKRQHGHDVR